MYSHHRRDLFVLSTSSTFSTVRLADLNKSNKSWLDSRAAHPCTLYVHSRARAVRAEAPMAEMLPYDLARETCSRAIAAKLQQPLPATMDADAAARFAETLDVPSYLLGYHSLFTTTCQFYWINTVLLLPAGQRMFLLVGAGTGCTH